MKLIIIEGLDGSGKTTLIKQLANLLQQQNKEVITLSGLGSSAIGHQIRQTFLTHTNLNNPTRLHLSLANMYQTQHELIDPNIKTDKIILIDRWIGSNYAYRVYPSQNPTINQIFNQSIKNFIQPNMTIYLKIDPKIGLNRKQKQANHQLDVIEQSPLSYHHQVALGFEQFMKRKDIGHKIILDTTTNQTTNHNIETIFSTINKLKPILTSTKEPT
ncbi:dTMP kinase [Candidatus Phytoplasma meliae]|uniref:Thymidylate kinase n=1 Tax=Candidatus Phytoplasma meliae TaxID=1848402 RepID=A0ABS5CXC5_9MOLU|nr:dTMP kinase [Candidatus Phytoplasma meliae]MBP5835639.1 dTMP kinase [Candidatus Phytoplasma meliae]